MHGRRLIRVVLGVAAVALVVAAPAAAQLPYQTEVGGESRLGSGISLDRTVVQGGGPLTVTGFGYGANTPVRLQAFSTVVELGSVTTNAAGGFVRTVIIPASIGAGPHTLRASSATVSHDAGFTVVIPGASVLSESVTAAPAAGAPAAGTPAAVTRAGVATSGTTGTALARTGLMLSALAGLASVLIAAGWLLVRTSQPRRADTAG